MFKNQIKTTFLFSFCSLIFSQYTVAGLIRLDDAVFGTDSIILDDVSGTEWLRIDLTTSLAPEIRNGTGFGQRFKLANAEELTELMRNTGVITSHPCSAVGCGSGSIAISSESEKADAVREFQLFFGTTTTPFGIAETLGLYDIGNGFYTDSFSDSPFDRSPNYWNSYGPWFLAVVNNSDWSYRGNVLGCFAYNDCLNDTPPPGYWIIRTDAAPAPEPSLFILLSLGLVTVFTRKRKIGNRPPCI